MKPDEIAVSLSEAERDTLLGRVASEPTVAEKLREAGLWDEEGGVTPLGLWVRQAARVRKWFAVVRGEG